jgi:serine/threonine-protein kinase
MAAVSADVAPGSEPLPESRSLGTVGNGKYRLFARIGRGGMADVLLSVAHGPVGFNKLVVVKRLRSILIDNPESVTMFLDEARLAARLNHPNVVHTYEVCEQKGIYFIAMEYLDGQPLHKLAKAAAEAGVKVKPALWARVVADALKGLHYAHELTDYNGAPLHIIHRDVSPQNIFVTYTGTVKVVDFGIAKTDLNETKTETGILKGKIAYLAPEQAQAAPIDARVDLFAMGIVLWELLTDKRLVQGDAASALNQILNRDFPRVRDEATDCPAELDAIAMRALERDVTKRFQSAQEMRSALEAYIRKSGESVDDAEIGALVLRLFDKERADLRRRIEKHVAIDDDNAALPDLSASEASRPSLPPTSSIETARLAAPAIESTNTSTVYSAVQPSPHAASPSRRNVVVAMGVVAAAIVAAIAFVVPRGGSMATKPVDPTPLPTASQTAAPGVATIRITLRASPPSATLFLDDSALPSNPYAHDYPADGTAHRVRASAPSYGDETREIVFDANASMEISLTRDAPAADSASSASSVASAPSDKPKGPLPAVAPNPPASVPTPHDTAAPIRPKPPRPTLDKDIWK